MNDSHCLLSICIPTFNRSEFLRTSLERFRKAIEPDMNIELLISDNCSPDNTPEVVAAAIHDGLKCTYIRNDKNIGPDGNFLQCFNKAKGKYIWLCGDDDFLLPESFRSLYDMLLSDEYGLIELNVDKNKYSLSPRIYKDTGEFLSDVHIWITFVSGNIFRKEVVNTIDGYKYDNTFLLQVPYFLASATIGLPNVIYYPKVLETGADSKNNGGYNLFQVFCENLLTIINELVILDKLTKKQFLDIKKSIFCKWMINYYDRLFIKKDYGNFEIDNAKEILYKWYGRELYYYLTIFKLRVKQVLK